MLFDIIYPVRNSIEPALRRLRLRGEKFWLTSIYQFVPELLLNSEHVLSYLDAGHISLRLRINGPNNEEEEEEDDDDVLRIGRRITRVDC